MKPAAAPPSGPPATAATDVNRPTANFAAPGCAFASSLSFVIA